MPAAKRDSAGARYTPSVRTASFAAAPPANDHCLGRSPAAGITSAACRGPARIGAAVTPRKDCPPRKARLEAGAATLPRTTVAESQVVLPLVWSDSSQ